MHGNNLNSLHQLIHPEILPSELGGMMPPYDMGTWARTLLDHAYDEETDYCPESYTLSVQDLERDLEKNLSPKTMKRSVCCLAVPSPSTVWRQIATKFTTLPPGDNEDALASTSNNAGKVLTSVSCFPGLSRWSSPAS